jgi:regulator of extracellular matrix RemA (YlzA/DUF370 family)
MKLIRIGSGHTIVAERIIGVFTYGSRSLVRLRQEFETKKLVVNVTNGEKVKTAILVENGFLFLSSIATKTINTLLEKQLDNSGNNV